MKATEVLNNALHYAAFAVLMLAWYYLATKPGGFAQTAAGGQMIGVIQGAMVAIGGVKGSTTLMGFMQQRQLLLQSALSASMSDNVGKAPSVAPLPQAASSQAGYARWSLLGFLGAMGVVLAMVAACAGLGTVGPQTTGAPMTAASAAESQYVSAMSYHNAICTGWSVAYNAALQLRKAGAASPTLIAQVNANEKTMNTACSPPFPSTAAAVTAQATQVATEVGLIEVILKKENAK